MGSDRSDTSFALPLVFLYTDITLKVYHVKNPTETFVNGSGHDNVGCGHLDWPCKTIKYAYDRSGTATVNKVGIISGYKIIES
jgi:hypothetical protein